MFTCRINVFDNDDNERCTRDVVLPFVPYPGLRLCFDNMAWATVENVYWLDSEQRFDVECIPIGGGYFDEEEWRKGGFEVLQ